MAKTARKMSDREIVAHLLLKENEISNKIHHAVTEILRHGYESERGKEQVPDMIDSIQYILEDIEMIVNKWEERNE